jgi:hypothetical protein
MKSGDGQSWWPLRLAHLPPESAGLLQPVAREANRYRDYPAETAAVQEFTDHTAPVEFSCAPGWLSTTASMEYDKDAQKRGARAGSTIPHLSDAPSPHQAEYVEPPLLHILNARIDRDPVGFPVAATRVTIHLTPRSASGSSTRYGVRWRGNIRASRPTVPVVARCAFLHVSPSCRQTHHLERP